MSRNRRQRPTAPEPTRAPITPAEIRELGRELVRELAAAAGDPDAVRAVLMARLDIEGTSRLALASMAALHLVFSDCLTPVPVDQIPADALTLTTPTEGES